MEVPRMLGFSYRPQVFYGFHRRERRCDRTLIEWDRDVDVLLSGCEITVRHRTCPTNLAQRLIEKRFLLLNAQTMSVENLFVVKP